MTKAALSSSCGLGLREADVVLVEHVGSSHGSDWVAQLEKHAGDPTATLSLRRGVADDVPPLEIGQLLLKWQGAYSVDAPDVPAYRELLAKLGAPFIRESESEWGRLFLESAGIPADGIAIEKKKWTQAYIDGLPDSAFLYVAEATSQVAQKSEAPSLRYFPVYDSDGNLDLPHLRSAIAQVAKADLPESVQGQVQREGRRLLEGATAKLASSEELVSTQKSYAVRFLRKEERVDADGHEEHIIYGVVLEPDPQGPDGEGGDTQGDTYSEDEVRKACFGFMEYGRHFKVQHKGQYVDGKILTLENFLAPVTYVTVDSTGTEVTIKKGTWLHGARVVDDEIWEAAKNGELTGWSIGGWSKTVEL
jgi:hypothetical protein